MNTNSTTDTTRSTSIGGWFRTHRITAAAIAAGVVLVAGGGTVAGTAMTKQHAVDDWATARAKLTAIAKTGTTWATRYDTARKQTQATAALAKDLVEVRGGAMDDTLWKPLSTARDAASDALDDDVSVRLTAAPQLAGTDRASYETATVTAGKVLRTNTATVGAVKTSTRDLEQARAAMLAAGGKIAAAVVKDEEFRKGRYPDATQQSKDAVHRAAGTATRALQQHPGEDLVLTSTRDYLKAVHALQKSNAEQAAARKAALDAQAAAAAALAPASSTGSGGGVSSAGGSSNGGWSASSGAGVRGSGGGSVPSTGGGASAGGGVSTGGSRPPAPSTGGGSAGGSGSSGGGSTARPQQYALMHSTKVASCNPGEYIYSFGPNIGSMPSRYLSVSVSWNGSDWVYNGTTCGT